MHTIPEIKGTVPEIYIITETKGINPHRHIKGTNPSM